MANFRDVNRAISEKFPDLNITVYRGEVHVYFGSGVLDFHPESLLVHPVKTTTAKLIELSVEAIKEWQDKVNKSEPLIKSRSDRLAARSSRRLVGPSEVITKTTANKPKVRVVSRSEACVEVTAKTTTYKLKTRGFDTPPVETVGESRVEIFGDDGEPKSEAELESAGYESWIEKWVESGEEPDALDCPARHMALGPLRQAFVRGWLRARTENSSS